MESGYKHFSHMHNLVMHEMPESAEVSCSGCNSTATNTVYVCWQCKFFLHEQCFRANRSRKHPSHPPHPLTLVPYPTYPSNSFYCNSCKIIGTGFSYSCSECDFDLHVQCAYSIADATNYHQPHQVISPHPCNPSYPNTIPQGSYMAQSVTPFSVPTSAQNPITSAQNVHIAHNNAVGFVPTGARNEQSANHCESGQNKPRIEEILHFSHPHGLVPVNVKHGKKKIACSGCHEMLVGKGYSCVEACHFHLHESCFNLQKEIRHKSHLDHPLALLPSAPYGNKNGEFTCNACFKDGTGFTYNCSICEVDLHVKCATLKETVKRNDHEHELKLLYSCPLKGEEYTFYCDVCDGVVPRGQWTYYCKPCDYGTHLGCVDREECNRTSRDTVADGIANLKMLQEAMEIARINAISRANILNSI